jgi:hypothetical protein
LGQIASRGHARALDVLLRFTAHGSNGDVLQGAAARSASPEALRDDLVEMALQGLARSGDARARLRLVEIESGRIQPVQSGRDLKRSAHGALGLFDELSGAGSGSAPATAGSTGTVSAAATTSATGTQSAARDAGLDYANHVAVTNPMTDVRLDEVLTQTSKLFGTSSYAGDVACCMTFSRTNTARTFGSAGDGLDIIDNGTELNAVLNHSAARMKIVRAINYCGSTGTNYVGCGWIGGDGVAVVRMSSSGTEAVLWAHEYGHNVGLNHNSDSRCVMYGTISSTHGGVTSTECDRYQAPVTACNADLQTTGTCADTDGDGVQDGIDNCPAFANATQADADGDGISDVCDFTGCGNGVREEAKPATGSMSVRHARRSATRQFSGHGDCTFDVNLLGLRRRREAGEECDGADRLGKLRRPPLLQRDAGVLGAVHRRLWHVRLPDLQRQRLCRSGEDAHRASDCFSNAGSICGNGVCGGRHRKTASPARPTVVASRTASIEAVLLRRWAGKSRSRAAARRVRRRDTDAPAHRPPRPVAAMRCAAEWRIRPTARSTARPEDLGPSIHRSAPANNGTNGGARFVVPGRRVAAPFRGGPRPGPLNAR